MTINDLEEFKKKLDLKKAELSKLRDEFREMVSELDSLADDATEAVDLLDQASDSLSRLV